MDKAEALIAVLREHGTRVPANGNVSCMFHEDTSPSMSIDRARGLFKCHSCGRGGDVFTLVQEWQGLSFEEAKEKLEGGGLRMGEVKAVEPTMMDVKPTRLTPVQEGRVDHLSGVLRLAEANLAQSDQGMAYLAARGFSAATVRSFRLGLGTAESGRYMGKLVIPYLGPDDRPVSLRARCLQDHDHVGHGKYDGMAGDRTRMFNTNAVLRNPTSREIHVAEGEQDTMSLSQAGLLAVGFPGVNAVKSHHLTILDGFDTVYLWCDNDEPGRAMSDRLMSFLPRARPVTLPGNDVNDVLAEHGEAGVLKIIGR